MPRRTRANDDQNRPATPKAEVTSQRVHPWVWTEALRAADGDARRIEVLSETEAITRNYRVR